MAINTKYKTYEIKTSHGSMDIFLARSTCYLQCSCGSLVTTARRNMNDDTLTGIKRLGCSCFNLKHRRN